MEYYKLMPLISLACLFVAEWSGVMQWLSWNYFEGKRIKPIDCAMCLTFHVALWLFIYLHYEGWSFLYACANAGLTVLINTIYERITKK